MADQARYLTTWEPEFGVERFSPSLKKAFLNQLEKELKHRFENTTPDAFFEEGRAVVSKYMEAQQLTALLYRIDVKEEEALKCMSSPDQLSAFTRAILMRIAQKVIFRMQYSGK